MTTPTSSIITAAIADPVTKGWLLLAALAAFGILALGWRSWRQWRRTSSAGFHGVSGRAGSLEWFGGVLIAAGFVLAAVSPVLVVSGALAVIDLPPLARYVADAIGALLFVAGFAGTLIAQRAMGDAWRIGVDADERTELVSRGLFRVSRNPIFTSMLALLIGLVAMLPHAVSALALVAALAGLEIQVRLVEEPYLQRAHGERYARYAARVGRFLPHLGRLTPRGHGG